MSHRAPEQLHEALPRIFALVPPVEFAAAAAVSCRRFSLAWYFSLFSRVVTVPDDAPTVNKAINRLADGSSDPMASRRGLVVVRPGVYPESVRVTQNCCVLGLGRRGAVVVEAPGWESALVFSGLGVRGFCSGEDACIANMTFRCRNELMRGRCVYIVLGQPYLQHCHIEGGVQVSGYGTAPRLYRCRVQSSWASGVHFTDHCSGSLRDCAVTRNRRHGVLADRGSCPEVSANRISGNGMCGIRIYTAATPAHGSMDSVPPEGGAAPAETGGRVRGNVLDGNGEDCPSLTPRFADTEELQLDIEDAEGGDDGAAGPGGAPGGEPYAVFEPVGTDHVNWRGAGG